MKYDVVVIGGGLVGASLAAALKHSGLSLARLLTECGAQSDCGDAQLLRSYERKRKEDIYSMQAVTYGLKHLFNNNDSLLRSVRNLGLNATNRLAPIKKLLMQHAFN